MKKYAKLLVPALFLIIVGGLIYSFSKNTEVTEEFVDYTPAEEISDEQMKRTKIALFFLDKTTNEIIKDEKYIRTTLLIDEPAKALINEIINSTPLENTLCPLNSYKQFNNIIIEKNISILDLSKEFFNHGLSTIKQEENLIQCIVNTLCQLNEIDGVKILVDGEPLEQSNLGLNLSQTFLPTNVS